MRNILDNSAVMISAIVFIVVSAFYQGPGFSSAFAESGDYSEVRELMDEGWWDDALEILEKRIRAAPDDPELNFLLGKLYHYKQDYDKADDYFKNAIKLDDSKGDYHLWLGHTRGMKAQTGSPLKAIFRAKGCRKCYETALEKDPENIDAHFSIFQYYLQAPGIAGGDKDRARREAEIIAGLDTLRGYLARSMVNEFIEKDQEKAEEELTRAIEFDSTRSDAYYCLSAYYIRQGRDDLAESTYTRYLRIDSKNADAYQNIGFFLQQRKRYDEAAAAFQRSLELDSTDIHNIYQIGKTFVLSENNLESAEGCFKRYLAAPRLKGYWPSRAAAHWRLAMVYDLQGKYNPAISELEKALALDSEYEEAKELLKQIRKKQK